MEYSKNLSVALRMAADRPLRRSCYRHCADAISEFAPVGLYRQPFFIAMNSPYDPFAVIAEVEVDGWTPRLILDYVEKLWGDGYVIAPMGGRAGIVWTIGTGDLKVLLPPDEKGWGVYDASFPDLMENEEDLRKNFCAILPDLKIAYDGYRQGLGE